MNVSTIWKREKAKMLAAINHQATLSLKAIKSKFQCNGPIAQGFFLSQQFKNDFIVSTNAQIQRAYEEFEIFSKLEDELNNRDKLSSMFPVLDANEHQTVNSILAKMPTSNDSIELSDDEVKTNRAQIHSNTIGLADSTAMWEIPDNFRSSRVSNRVETGFATADNNQVQSSSLDKNSVGERGNFKEEPFDDDIPVITIGMGFHGVSTSGTALFKSPKRVNGVKNDNNLLPSDLKPTGLGKKKGRRPNLTQSHLKRFKCPYCNYASDNKACVKVHLRIHTGEKPYKCKYCIKRFTQSNGLQYHLKRCIYQHKSSA